MFFKAIINIRNVNLFFKLRTSIAIIQIKFNFSMHQTLSGRKQALALYSSTLAVWLWATQDEACWLASLNKWSGSVSHGHPWLEVQWIGRPWKGDMYHMLGQTTGNTGAKGKEQINHSSITGFYYSIWQNHFNFPGRSAYLYFVQLGN